MPAFNPANIHIAEIQVYGSLAAGGSNSKNTIYTFHYLRRTFTSPVVKATLDAFFQAAVVVPLLAAVNVRWAQLYNTIRWMDDVNDAPVPQAHANVGGVATDGMDSVATAYFLMRTGFRGKYYRGSKHFAGLSEADTTQPNDDILNAAAITRFAAIGTGMSAPLVDGLGNTWDLAIVSRTLSQLRVNPTSIEVNPVTTILLNKRIGRMKKRQPVSVY